MIILEQLLLEDDADKVSNITMSQIAKEFCRDHQLPPIDQLGFCISKVKEQQKAFKNDPRFSDFLISEANLPSWSELGIKKPFKGCLGITYYDSMQLEFLEAGIGSNFYSQLMSSPNETRLHHLGFFVEELGLLTRRMKAAGYPLYVVGKSRIGSMDINFHYIDTLDELGFFLEFISCSINDRHFVPDATMFKAMAFKQTQLRSF